MSASKAPGAPADTAARGAVADDARAKNEADRQELDKIDRAVAGILAAIEDGMDQPIMKARMEELERREPRS